MMGLGKERVWQLKQKKRGGMEKELRRTVGGKGQDWQR
jgi:hypothetical protein